MSEDIIDDDLFSNIKEDKSTKENSSEKENGSEDKSVENNDYVLPHISGSEIPVEFKNIVERFIAIYKTLPEIDYDEVSRELSTLSIKQTPTSTLQMINLHLQKVQACKDRLAEIYQDVVKCYSFKKRAVNILSDAWGKFSSGGSADKRKSDCAYRLSEFFLDLARIEALNNECEHVLKNLDSLNNNLSRQITIIQSQLKLFDLGRGALPDFDFNKGQLNDAFESLGDSDQTEKSDNDDEDSNKVHKHPEPMSLSFD